MGTFAHEHSHNLIFDSPRIKLVDALLDWSSTSFAENLKYVYSHSRFHHPNLGDKDTDSELENKSLPDHWWNRTLYFAHILCPGLILLEILTKQPSENKSKGSRDFQVPKTWFWRKMICYAASLAACLFYAYNGGLMIQMWSIGIY